MGVSLQFRHENIIQNWGEGGLKFDIVLSKLWYSPFLQSYTVYWVRMKEHQTCRIWKIKNNCYSGNISPFEVIEWIRASVKWWRSRWRPGGVPKITAGQRDYPSNAMTIGPHELLFAPQVWGSQSLSLLSRSIEKGMKWPTDWMSIAMWCYTSIKVAWADCSHSWLSALGFTQHMPEKPCSMQEIRSEK